MVGANPFQSVEGQNIESLLTGPSPFRFYIQRMQDAIQQRIEGREPTAPQSTPSPSINTPRPRPGQRSKEAKAGGARVAQADTGTQIDTAQIVFQGLVARGLPPVAAAGFTGNIEQESNFDMTRVGGAGEITALQLFESRADDFRTFAASEGKDPTSIETALDFLVFELGTTEKPAYKRILAAKTVQEAAIAVSEAYFRPGDPRLENRVANAEKLDIGLVSPETPPITPSAAPAAPAPPAVAPTAPVAAPARPSAPTPPVTAPVLAQLPAPPSTGVVRRRVAVPAAWQQAVGRFLQSKDPKDLAAIPKGSMPVIMALMGKATRSPT